ncbi:MAG: nucleoside triphosphate pyrophosphohydrolase [Acidimicrobiia bacterium]
MITVVGLGPAGLDNLASGTRRLLEDPQATVVARTLHHPAARRLAEIRPVQSGDDLYATADDFESVYARLVERVLDAARGGDVVYAVPGHPRVGEASVALLMQEAAAVGVVVEMAGGRSFLDALFERLGVDPLASGLTVLDGRNLPDPLLLRLPTVIAQVDTPLVLADVASTLDRMLAPETPVTVASDLAGPDEQIAVVALDELPTVTVGLRTCLFIDPPPNGFAGLVTVSRRLRMECPWDRRQTHHSLLPHLLEEAYEAYEALAALPAAAPGGEPDWGAYADVEEEMGDLLLQFVFHATLAEEAGAFHLEDAAEVVRRKLIRRHPHVFGDVVVGGADEVLANWEKIKKDEKGRGSVLEGVPVSLPGLARARELQDRAAATGFDWPDVSGVQAKVDEELAELRAAVKAGQGIDAELGDVLFTVVNLARHLGIDPELAVRTASDRFAARFRKVEAEGPLDGLALGEMDARWERAKEAEA